MTPTVTTTVTTIDSGLLSQADRDRVAAAAAKLDDLELPPTVGESMRSLLARVAAGYDTTILTADQQLTSNQAAQLLGMSRPLLNKLLDEGRIPFHRNGRDRRIAASDVLAFISARDELKHAHRLAAAGYESRREERLAAIAAADTLPS